MKTLGLIGFGRFGQLLYNQLHTAIPIQVYDPDKQADQNLSAIPFYNLEHVCKNDLVILAVPVSSIRSVCQEIAPYLSSQSLVMDVCAVKTYPLQVMAKHFPAGVQIVGSHPLFGPDSVKDSLQDHIMIVTPYQIRDDDLDQIKRFWEGFGIRIIEMTPDEQDRLMAWTLAMTHFIGRALNGLPLPEPSVATRDYRNLIDLMRKINRDTWELFEDMHHYNPYTKEMRQKLFDSLQSLKQKLDKF
ncbi:MAG: prephenate dehydrogenase [bacterium]|nr:MAG: prephenate dehydrogenase [bacterium]